jgi:hypothetical protein
MAKISDEAYEELRFILERQYGQNFTPEDVKEIGDGLINFYGLILEIKNNNDSAESVN